MILAGAALLVALQAGVGDAVARLDAELAASRSATATLEARCGAPIRAALDRAEQRPPTPEQRAALAAGPDEPVRYRHVRLMCGARIFSDAENWYVPARLTPAMNALLDASDTPFGTAIRPLAPSRRTLARERLEREGAGTPAGPVLRHRALVLDGAGRSLALVVETYSRAALAE